MGTKTVIALVYATIALSAVPAKAQGQLHFSSSNAGAKSPVVEYGRTLPPVGFVGFCVRNPADCRKDRAKPVTIDMTPERWGLLYQVNTFVNGKIAPVSDQELFGEPEYWTYPTDAGDCEDYVLLKKRHLESLGFSGAALLITVVLDETGGGHAVLLIETKDGDFVLDNRRNEIRLWSSINYRFLKRQSRRDPRVWVALTDVKSDGGEVASGDTQR
jgi:predicted transglutaminase-like cysteine proteinase